MAWHGAAAAAGAAGAAGGGGSDPLEDVAPADCISCAGAERPVRQRDRSGKAIRGGPETLIETAGGIRVWGDAQCRAVYVATPVAHVRRLSDLDDADLAALWRCPVATMRRFHGPGTAFTSIRVNHGLFQNLPHLHMKVWMEEEPFRSYWLARDPQFAERLALVKEEKRRHRAAKAEAAAGAAGGGEQQEEKKTRGQEEVHEQGAGGGGVLGDAVAAAASATSAAAAAAVDAVDGCGWTLTLDESRKHQSNIYGVSKTGSKFTCYCHHFTPDGRHCVEQGLGPEEARVCRGVMFGDIKAAAWALIGMGNIKLVCRKQNVPPTHTMCRATQCPFVAAGQLCPYSVDRDYS